MYYDDSIHKTDVLVSWWEWQQW